MKCRLTPVLLIVMVSSLAHAQMPSTTSVPASGGDIVITALGHASVQFEQGGKVIIVDPVTKPADLSRAKPADLILVTDIHPDHFDPAAIAKLRKPGAPVVVPTALAGKVPDAIVMANRQLKANDQAPAGINIVSVPAYNLERGPAPGQLYHPEGRGQGYLLTIGAKLIYVAGDTECVPAMKMWVKNVEVAFVPMNLPYTMTPAEAAECVRQLRPKIAIPYHYMGQDPQEFVEALKGEKIEVRLLNWYP